MDNDMQVVLDRLRSEAETQRQEEIEEIKGYDPKDMVEYINHALDTTDVVVEGFSMSANVSEGGGIALAGLMRTREALESAALWIGTKFPEALADSECGDCGTCASPTTPDEDGEL